MYRRIYYYYHGGPSITIALQVYPGVCCFSWL